MRGHSTLVAVRVPSKRERKNGAEIVFVRRDYYGRRVNIYAAKCYESWQQWGADTDLLWDNVSNVERWRHRGGLH